SSVRENSPLMTCAPLLSGSATTKLRTRNEHSCQSSISSAPSHPFSTIVRPVALAHFSTASVASGARSGMAQGYGWGVVVGTSDSKELPTAFSLLLTLPSGG